MLDVSDNGEVSPSRPRAKQPAPDARSQTSAQLWPGFLLVGLGMFALMWHRTNTSDTGDATVLQTVVLWSVPILIVAGVALLLRGLKAKEQALKD